jgi:hypothetical protein
MAALNLPDKKVQHQLVLSEQTPWLLQSIGATLQSLGATSDTVYVFLTILQLFYE